MSESDVRYVSSGVTSSGVVDPGINLVVLSGGMTERLAVRSGGEEEVLAGGSDSQSTLFGIQIISGGSATRAVVSAGGSQQVFGSAGASEIIGSATDTIVRGSYFDSATGVSLNGGVQYVGHFGTAIHTTISSGGVQLVGDEGSALEITVLSGGSGVVDGGVAASVEVRSGGIEKVDSGSQLSGLVVESGGILELDAAAEVSGVRIEAGGAEVLIQVVSSGQSVSGLTFSGAPEPYAGQSAYADSPQVIYAYQYVLAGGSATGTTVLADGEENVSGVAFDTYIGMGGEQDVQSTGVASNTVLSGGQLSGQQIDALQEVIGLAAGVTIGSAGDATVYGSATGVSVLSGGAILISPGAYVSAIVVSSGGTITEWNETTISSLVLQAGAFVIHDDKVFSGQSLSNYRVSSGAIVDVASGGKVFGVTALPGGLVDVAEGGSASGATVKSGGDIVVGGSATNVVVSAGGQDFIGSGYIGGEETQSNTVVTGSGAILYAGLCGGLEGEALGVTKVTLGGEVDDVGLAVDDGEGGGVQPFTADIFANLRIGAGGTDLLDGDDQYNVVLAGASGGVPQLGEPSGYAYQLVVDAGETNAVVSSGGWQEVRGGEADDTVLSGGVVEVDTDPNSAVDAGSIAYLQLRSGATVLDYDQTRGDIVVTVLRAGVNIDLEGVVATSASVVVGQLTATSGGTVVANDITVSGSVAGLAFSAGSDGHGGTLLVVTSAGSASSTPVQAPARDLTNPAPAQSLIAAAAGFARQGGLTLARLHEAATEAAALPRLISPHDHGLCAPIGRRA